MPNNLMILTKYIRLNNSKLTTEPPTLVLLPPRSGRLPRLQGPLLLDNFSHMRVYMYMYVCVYTYIYIYIYI